MKTRVAVLFGGRSVEHEVSVISGLQALAALDRNKYDAFPLYISKDNRFFVGEGLDAVASYRDMDACLAKATRVLPVPGDGCVELVRYPMKKFGNNTVAVFDVAVPVVHGTNVEDGTLMGYLEMLGVPYAACDVTSSALGMDKFAMKGVLRQAGLPVLPAKEYTGREYAADGDRVMDEISEDDFVLVTADHGGHDRTHGTDMKEDMEIPFFMTGPGMEAGRELAEFNIKDIAPTVLKLFDIAVPEVWEGKALV